MTRKPRVRKPAKYKTGTRRVKLSNGQTVTVRVFDSRTTPGKGNRRGAAK